MSTSSAAARSECVGVTPQALAEIQADFSREWSNLCVQAINQGVVNFLADLKKGRITQTDEMPFKLGGNVATTPEAVVFENHLFQLI